MAPGQPRMSAKARLGLRLETGPAPSGGGGTSPRQGRSNVRQRLGVRKRSWSPAEPRVERKRGVVNQTEIIRERSATLRLAWKTRA